MPISSRFIGLERHAADADEELKKSVHSAVQEVKARKRHAAALDVARLAVVEAARWFAGDRLYERACSSGRRPRAGEAGARRMTKRTPLLTMTRHLVVNL